MTSPPAEKDRLLRKLNQSYARPPWLLKFNLTYHLQRYWSSARVHYFFWVKRVFDLIVSGLFLLLFSPVYLILVFLIRRDGGPALYSQVRIGENGRPFKFYKFRSMIPDADKYKGELLEQNEMKTGVTFKMGKDPRVTPIGRFLRKTSLDELPQLWNVFKGEMSLVGPRPPLPEEVLKYTALDRQRLTAQQGITCIWQVSGRSDIDFEGQVELDLRYIEDLTLRKDLSLLLKTIPAVISGKGAR